MTGEALSPARIRGSQQPVGAEDPDGKAAGAAEEVKRSGKASYELGTKVAAMFAMLENKVSSPGSKESFPK